MLHAYQHELNYSAYLIDKSDERRDLDDKGHDIANGYMYRRIVIEP